jgi:uncharacterized protein YecT (DUF1311 family)
LLLLSTTAALADDPPIVRSEDRAAINACLEKQKDDPEHCISAVLQPCIDAPRSDNDPYPHDSTRGQGDCTQREIAVWDEKSAASLKALRDGPLGKTTTQPWNRPPQNKRAQAVPGTNIIDDMERTWVSFRAKLCDTEAMQYEEGSLSRVVYIKCVNRETARHALWLAQQVDANQH